VWEGGAFAVEVARGEAGDGSFEVGSFMEAGSFAAVGLVAEDDGFLWFFVVDGGGHLRGCSALTVTISMGRQRAWLRQVSERQSRI
jgi:hypothetical protein